MGERSEKSEPAAVGMTILGAGAAVTRERIFGTGRSWRKIRVPALFALIEHPVVGTGLFDTGYSTHFAEAVRSFPERLYGLLTPVDITAEEDAARQVERRGIALRDVEWVIVSHFDPDHIGGLRDFPNARIICSRRAWEEVEGKTGWKALAARYLPGLVPADITTRLRLLPDPEGPALGPFDHSLDLFGDGSIRLVSLPGHAPGMLGAFVHTGEAGDFFLCADACWSLDAIESGGPPRGVHRRIATDKGEQDETYRKLARLKNEMPDLQIVPSHCPRTARRLIDS